MTNAEREQLKAEVRRRLRIRAEAKQAPSGRLPRYDQVYFDGVRWLDELARSEAYDRIDSALRDEDDY